MDRFIAQRGKVPEPGTIWVKCPGCGITFLEKDSEIPVASCLNCNAMGPVVFDEEPKPSKVATLTACLRDIAVAVGIMAAADIIKGTIGFISGPKNAATVSPMIFFIAGICYAFACRALNSPKEKDSTQAEGAEV